MNNILQMLQTFRNPQALMQNILNNPQFSQNPMMQNALDLYNKGDVQGLQNLAQNLAKSQGVSLDDLRKQFGI